MSEKPVDLEWMEVGGGAVTYEEAQKIVFDMNEKLPKEEKRWRLPHSHDMWFIKQHQLKGAELRNNKYMCRSSRVDGKIAIVDLKGKKDLIDPEETSHFCLVR